MHYRDRSLWRHLSRVLRSKHGLSPSDIANALECYSKKRVGDGALFRFATGEFLKMESSSLSMWDVNFVIHAYARAGVWDEPLFRMMGRVASRLIDQCPEGKLLEQSSCISTAFSYAETRKGSMIRAGSIYRAISKRILSSGTELAGNTKTRHIANILNSFARSRVWDETLFRRLSTVVRTMQPVATPAKDIAYIVNAYSQATTRIGSRLRDTSLFLHMARIALLKNDDELTARNVAEIVNAFARGGVWDERLFKRMSAALRSMPPSSIGVKDIARIVQAFSLAHTRAGSTIRDGSLFRHMSSLTVRKLSKTGARSPAAAAKGTIARAKGANNLPSDVRSIISDIAATAKAYTRAGVWDERLFRLLSGAVKEEMRMMPGEMISVRNLADIALAFSFMETRFTPKPSSRAPSP